MPEHGAKHPRYDAFICHSSRDAALAEALDAGLAWIGRRWYRARAFRAFRDQAELTPLPLKPSIAAALQQSSTLILLASPEAAASDWVPWEVETWRARGEGQVFIVLTGGELVWDPAAGDFDWSRTTALPSTLRGWFKQEPLYLDARFSRTSSARSFRDPKPRDIVVSLAAGLSGRTKAEVWSEHTQRARTAKAVASAGAVGLLVLLASSFWLYTERARSEKLARARRLAAASARVGPADSVAALVLAIASADSADTAESLQAVLASSARPIPKALLRHGVGLQGARLSPDGKRLVTFSEDGVVKQWDVEEAKELSTDSMPGGGQAGDVTFDDAHARFAVVSESGGLLVRSLGSGDAQPLRHEQGMTSACFSGDGNMLVTGHLDGTVWFWEARTDWSRRPGISKHSARVTALVCSKGKAYSAGEDGTLLGWDARQARQLGELITLSVRTPVHIRLGVVSKPDVVAVSVPRQGAILLNMANGGWAKFDCPSDWDVQAMGYEGADSEEWGWALAPCRFSDRRMRPNALRLLGLKMRPFWLEGQATPAMRVAATPDFDPVVVLDDQDVVRLHPRKWRPEGVEDPELAFYPARELRAGQRTLDVGVSRDGALVVTADWDGIVRLWETHPEWELLSEREDILAAARKLLPAQLTAEEQEFIIRSHSSQVLDPRR